MRALQLPVGDGQRLARAGRRLGQDLFDPPNVKGWPGGKAWIDSASPLARREVIGRFTRGPMMAAVGRRMRSGGHRDTRAERARLRSLLLSRSPVNEPEADTMDDYIAQLLLDPAYQLN